MLTLVLGFAVGGILAGIVFSCSVGVGWSVFTGIVGFFGTAILINLRVKKRLEALFTDVQQAVEASQNQLRRKINMMQAKMVGGGKGLQRRMEKEQAEGIREALKKLDLVEPIYKWNFLAERQTNTVRAQLYFQIKEFDKADECFKKCLVMDPLTLAMKMVRQHKRNDNEALEKSFRKGVKRFKDEQGVMLYALYSWILVKQKRIDDAVEILNDAKDKTEDEVLKVNWEHLVNGRLRRFSNAGLGDQWYALHLEQPKPIKIKQRMGGGKKRLR